jgi:hypothetical protein
MCHVVTVAGPEPAQRHHRVHVVLAPAAHALHVAAVLDVMDRALVTQILPAHATQLPVASVNKRPYFHWDR